MSDNFYRAFEDLHRGSRELIKGRLSVYLQFVEPLKRVYSDCSVIDLGCGRGEWLELMTEIGFKPYGVDLDEGMLDGCLELNLPVEKGDAVAFLATLPSESQAVVSAFHVVEHVSFEQLRTIVSEALRVLKPGGLLIMETPNPENIVVATRNFYIDPTHQRPIPPPLLSFLPEYYGFARTKTPLLQESKELAEKESPTLNDVLAGVSPDYAVIAQKTAPVETLVLFDEVFDQEHGLSLDILAGRFDKRLQRTEEKVQQAGVKAQQAELKAQQAELKAQQAELKAQQAELKAQQAEAGLHAVRDSRSWRMTAPLRWASKAGRWFVSRGVAWMTFAPMSRPRRVVRQTVMHLNMFFSTRPRFKALILRLLAPFPDLRERLEAVGRQSLPESLLPNEGLDKLSPRARQIYLDLKAAIAQCHKGKD